MKKTTDSAEKVTPMMRQYNAVKMQYPKHILMFRMGDFYEMFGSDAVEASRILGITLTRRPWGEGKDMPLAGVPYHAVEAYLAKFIRAGVKVAICDQMEDPKKAKGIVKRAVTRIVTPGTILESDILDDKAHNFLVATWEKDGVWGLSVTDVSTGSFEIAEFRGPAAARQIFSEIGRLHPAEALLPDSLRRREGEWIDPTLQIALTWLPDTDFDPRSARRLLLDQFQVAGLEGYGAEGMMVAIGAAGALMQYLRDTQLAALRHINHLSVYNPSDFLVVDFTTQRSLELVHSIHDGSRHSTLVGVLDHTRTSMGGRMLRDWILQPLKDVAAIRARLDAVNELFRDGTLRHVLDERLRQVHDLERIISRVGLGAAGPRDLVALRTSLEQQPAIVAALAPPGSGSSSQEENVETFALGGEESGSDRAALLAAIRERIDPHTDLWDLLRRALADDVPYALRDGGVIRPGYNAQLDEYRSLATDTSAWIESMRRAEVERTGIQNLKIRYNKVFGFFIEVSKGNLDAVPPEYIRKQTLVNAERFITPELKEKEEIILNAQDRIAELEAQLFETIRDEAARRTRSVQRLAACLAELDALCSLSAAAIAGNYVKPDVDDSDTIDIRDGRHPVVEALQGERPFVPNDVHLANHADQVLLITGPNMAGKSTFIRQVALLTLMAQMGSFVPARSARVGVVDRIFTRIGAMDYLVRGQSTFLVEMNETANILNNATDRSLVILDEIGRGTSTYDGLSIAWAVVEYLHSTPGRRPKALFATHYHELTELAEQLPHVANFNTAVLEEGGEITFLYKIVSGGTDHSYGIYAARVAGLPRAAIERAEEVLHQLEFGSAPRAGGAAPVAKPDKRVRMDAGNGMVQLSLFDGLTHPVLEKLRGLEVNKITPIDALQILSQLADEAQ